jgi:hypothetical protein
MGASSELFIQERDNQIQKELINHKKQELCQFRSKRNLKKKSKK